MAGYTGTPLAQKLGIRPGHVVAVLDEPDGSVVTGALPEGVTVRRQARGRLDVVVVFLTEQARLVTRAPALGKAVAPDGMVWVAWPKRSSGMATDITENTVRDAVLPLGLVDVKVCAIDDTWSGLKLVWRKRLR